MCVIYIATKKILDGNVDIDFRFYHFPSNFKNIFI